MIKDILYNGVKGAFTRLVRLIVYIIIVLVITYVIGLISSKKASALVYKGLDAGIISAPGNTRSGQLGGASGQVVLDFDYSQRPISTTYDLIGFRIHNFSVQAQSYNNSNTTTMNCTGAINGNNTDNYNTTWYCSGTDNNNQNIEPNDFYINLFAFVYYTDNTSQFCYLSSEVQDTFLCPTMNSSTPVQKIQVYIKYVTAQTWLYTFQTSNNLAFYNYDSTEIVNSNGVIVNNQTTIIQQQQQQNQWAQSNTVTGAESSAQSGISTLQTTLNNKMSSVNGLTQVVLAPITMFTNLANNTCTPIRLTAPFVNTTFELPCMSGIYNQHFGILITLFATVIGGITGYWLCINIAKLIKELVDCDNDRIEVIDL